MTKIVSKIAKAVLPPFIVAAINQRRQRARVRHYASWEIASKAAGDTYSADVLTSFRIARSAGIVGVEENFIVPSAELISLLSSGSGSFVDFGGSGGELGAVLKKTHPSWSFTVVEIEGMAKAAEALGRPVNFTHRLPDQFDVFHSSGTLQYLEDPIAVWSSALSRTKRGAYLARNVLSENPVFTVQESRLFDNGAGPVPDGFEDGIIRYPHRTLSEKALVCAARNAGFRLVNRVAGRNSGVTADAEGSYGADLVFERVTPLVSRVT